MCEFLHLYGADYRELPQNGGVDDLKVLWKLRSRKTALDKPIAGGAGRATRQLRARLGDNGGADLKWSGGKAGT
jgi:hypothetical protein